MTGFGVAGFVFRKTGIPLAPIILGLVLGPLMEKNLRRALALSGGEWGVLVSSPLAVAIWVLAALVLFGPVVMSRVFRKGLRPST
jgi:putative tricarboxylic transport membrane protein